MENNNSNKNVVEGNLTPATIEYFLEFVYDRIPESFKDDKLTKREQAINYVNAINNK